MADLELSSQPISIQTIYTWFRESKLYVNRCYQRKLVWTLVEKQKLIESILNKYPVPAILIAEREVEKGAYEIIDGLQRLHAIVSFIETSYPTLQENYFDLDFFPTAKSASETGLFQAINFTNKLDQKDISTILDYNLALSVMRNATREQINDVFDRINTYGHRLSDQERRQAGIQNEFSNAVRQIACEIRGDVSNEVLNLSAMPSISIDLPMTKHGYEVRAEDVFWVQHGILRSTDLRDSMDEQCIADIMACIVGGEMITRSKDALDKIYEEGGEESTRILGSLNVYGPERISEEFKYCIGEITKVCNVNGDKKLNNIIFTKRNTNGFPSVFAVLFIALHELLIKENKIISDYEQANEAIEDLISRIEERRRAGSPKERRKDINTIKGLLAGSVIEATADRHIYENHSAIDIENSIRRSEVELANYELKQGLLTLDHTRSIDQKLLTKVINTICAIANNGPDREGKLLIGVTDKDTDVERIKTFDNITPKKIGKKWIVGVNREAKALGISTEAYFSKWTDAIRNSDLSVHLKDSVLAALDFHDFYGLGVIAVIVPAQQEMSYVGDSTYFRTADSTQEAKTAKDATSISQRGSVK